MSGLLGDTLNPQRSCARCGTKQPTFRRPRSVRQWAVGGWTCRHCGVELDRFGRALADHPRPSPYWYQTATERGGYATAAMSVVFFLLAVLEAAVLSVWVAAAFVLVGLLTLALGLTSAYAHRRWPVTIEGRRSSVDGSDEPRLI